MQRFRKHCTPSVGNEASSQDRPGSALRRKIERFDLDEEQCPGTTVAPVAEYARTRGKRLLAAQYARTHACAREEVDGNRASFGGSAWQPRSAHVAPARTNLLDDPQKLPAGEKATAVARSAVRLSDKVAAYELLLLHFATACGRATKRDGGSHAPCSPCSNTYRRACRPRGNHCACRRGCSEPDGHGANSGQRPARRPLA